MLQQKSYKELLYNNQIIKKGENCSKEYPKNCGVIDTLEQQLCIKEEENCPLYDIGIDQNYDSENYTYDGHIYYNNNNFTGNKEIFGRLILSDGQPFYPNKGYLWRKFVTDEDI